MKRASQALGVFALTAGLYCAGCYEDQCQPADFGGGYACGPEPGQYEMCALEDCNGSCPTHWTAEITVCPSTTPNCVQIARGRAVCMGDNLGPCDTPGRTLCEDAVTEIMCMSDGLDGHYWNRGPCALGARCYERAAGDLYGPEGCDPR